MEKENLLHDLLSHRFESKHELRTLKVRLARNEADQDIDDDSFCGLEQLRHRIKELTNTCKTLDDAINKLGGRHRTWYALYHSACLHQRRTLRDVDLGKRPNAVMARMLVIACVNKLWQSRDKRIDTLQNSEAYVLKQIYNIGFSQSLTNPVLSSCLLFQQERTKQLVLIEDAFVPEVDLVKYDEHTPNHVACPGMPRFLIDD